MFDFFNGKNPNVEKYQFLLFWELVKIKDEKKFFIALTSTIVFLITPMDQKQQLDYLDQLAILIKSDEYIKLKDKFMEDDEKYI